MRDIKEVEIYDTKASQYGSTKAEGENRKRKKEKEVI